MSAHDEKYLDFCVAYALGALDGDELREYEGHLKTGCPICSSELVKHRKTIGFLSEAIPQTSPSSTLKERILQEARRTRQSSGAVQDSPHRMQVKRVKPRPWLSFGIAFAVLIMIVGFSAYVSSLFKKIQEQHENIISQQNKIVELKTELEQKEAILKVLESRRIEVVTMDGLQVKPIAYGKIIWDPEKKVAILQVSHLPSVPKDKEYQLWVIKAKEPTKPISAGVFAVTVEREMESFFKVQPLEVVDRKEIGAFAVTLEPKGGVPQPTGEMYLLGKATLN
ncbi:MAG: anti-sigma factor [Ignavibacteriae bacterium]|nr:anti-sigma factor [Ignavibacteriota bacterium]